MEKSQTVQAKRSSYFLILVAAVLWGIIGMWNRRLSALGMSPYSIVMIRNFGGVLFLAAFFAIKDPSVFRIRLKHLSYFIGTGIISVLLFSLCYFSCQQVCSLAISSILLYTAPSIVVVLSAILWREKITGRKLAALILTLIGCATVCGIFQGDLSATGIGILLGLGSGFFYALYSIFSRFAINASYSPETITVWTFICSGIGSLVLLRPTEVAAAASSAEGWMMMAGVSIISTALPFLLYTKGLKHIDSGSASIAASLEPVVAALVGVIVFGEALNFTVCAGIVLVLAGVYILR